MPSLQPKHHIYKANSSDSTRLEQVRNVKANDIKEKEHLTLTSVTDVNANNDTNKNTNQVSKNTLSSHCLSPNPQEPHEETIHGSIVSPGSQLSHDTSVLAQLYQSSRRSRHLPGGNAIIISSAAIPPPPLTISLSLISQQHPKESNTIYDSSDEVEWACSVSSPRRSSFSSMSVSSMESSEDMMLDEEA